MGRPFPTQRFLGNTGDNMAQPVAVPRQKAGHRGRSEQLLHVLPSGRTIGLHQPRELKRIGWGHLQQVPSRIRDRVLVGG